MKRIVLITLIAGLFTPAGLYAQKVYKDDAKYILDLSVAAGMPAGAITTTPKTWTGTPANSGSYLANNRQAENINTTVYHKLEVAPYDMNTSGGMDNTGTMTMNWMTAFNGCRNSQHDGGNWRLPTQRELMLVYIFRPALESLGTGVFYPAIYWSATELNATNSWYVTFSNGSTTSTTKADSNRVRCVREIN